MRARQICVVHWGRLFICITLITTGVWLLKVLAHYLLDPCQGHQFKVALCEQFNQGVISGSLCSQLCKERTVHLRHCGLDQNGYRLFYSGELALKVQLLHLAALDGGHGLKTVYEEPALGTSMEEFAQTVTLYVQTKLGHGDHLSVVNRIMDTADVNHDVKVSLAEAKTIWSLLQHNEFFLLMAFSGDGHIPALQGFCGDLYAVEYVPHEYLYWKDDRSLWEHLFPGSYKWGFPAWEKRARIAVGLLEFTLDSLQHESGGEYYFCQTTERNIGYTNTYDVKLLDVSHILPKEELVSYLSVGQCHSDSDCEYTQHCRTVCDFKTNTCGQQLLRPNLQLVCQILHPYIMKGVPGEIAVDMVQTLDRCEHLSIHTPNIELETSLVLNDLKSLLWRQIIDD